MESQFEHCVIVFNPLSTNAKRSAKRIKRIHQLFGDDKITVIHLAADQQKNQGLLQRVADRLGPKTLLCIAGGDGTISFVVNQLMNDKGLQPNSRQTPILPIWGGNANDLGSMLNGPSSIADLHKIISTGHIITIHPLEVTIVSGDKKHTMLAVCYVSVGISALISKQINDPKYRQRIVHRLPVLRRFTELYTYIHYFWSSKPPFISVDGEQHHIYELLALNGSRIAKMDWVPIRLTDQAFYSTIFTTKWYELLFRIHKILLKRFGKLVHDSLEITVLSDTWIQVDGEAFPIAKDAKVTIRKDGRSFSALSTKLR